MRPTSRSLRPLRDIVAPNLDVLFVGINPGIRSASIGHHFAGYSNRFWKLLYDAKLVSEPIGTEDDRRLPEWRLGMTNLIARATPGIDTLNRRDYATGLRVLRRKVRRLKPKVVALVGVSLYRAIAGDVANSDRGRAAHRSRMVHLGLQRESFEGRPLFVLPNPSGRNANFSYAEMLNAFNALSAYRGAL